MNITSQPVGYCDMPPMLVAWINSGVHGAWIQFCNQAWKKERGFFDARNILNPATKGHSLVEGINIGYPGINEEVRGIKVTVTFSKRFVGHLGEDEIKKLCVDSCFISQMHDSALRKIDPLKWNSRIITPLAKEKTLVLMNGMLRKQQVFLVKQAEILEQFLGNAKSK